MGTLLAKSRVTLFGIWEEMGNLGSQIQGDLIWQILTYWAIVYFGQFFKLQK
jgi:hypothetical protein